MALFEHGVDPPRRGNMVTWESNTTNISFSEKARPSINNKGVAVVVMALVAMVIGILLVATIGQHGRRLVCDKEPHAESSVHGLNSGRRKKYLATNGEVFPWQSARLGTSWSATTYDIFLHPNLTNSDFRGNVKMFLQAKEATNSVVFHTSQLDIEEITVLLKGDQAGGGSDSLNTSDQFTVPVSIVRQLEYLGHEQCYVEFGETISSGSDVQIVVHFSGWLNKTDGHGFFLTKYWVNGQERVMASTQHEPVYARRTFPCLDEPQYKATFNLSVVREKRHKALSNMPLWKTSRYRASSDLVVDWFKVTHVPMSTYLVALVISDSKSRTKSTVSLWAPADKLSKAKFGLNAAVKLIALFRGYFAINSTFPKTDMVVIPGMVGSTANWGLLTAGQSNLIALGGPATDEATKQVARTLTRDILHQWFGNLVTMKWWDNLWMKEGLTSYFEPMGVDEINESFDGHSTLSLEMSRVLLTDSLLQTLPIQETVYLPPEILALYHPLVDKKGAAVIRMCASVIGQAKLQRAVQSYLKRHALKSTEPMDLAKAFQKENQVPEFSMIHLVYRWTCDRGHPVVTVTWDDSFIVLRQERFFLQGNGTKNVYPPLNRTWMIPFTYFTSRQPNKREFIAMKHKYKKVHFPWSSGGNSLAWLKGNKDMEGFYRVNYDTKGWRLLSEQLTRDHTVFSISDRITLVEDVLSLARAGYTNYSVALGLIQYAVNETSSHVWLALTPHLVFLKRCLQLEPEYDRFNSMDVLGPVRNSSLGGSNLDYNTKAKQKALVFLSMALQLPTAYLHDLNRRFGLWKNNTSYRLHDLVTNSAWVYRIGIEWGGVGEWLHVYRKYLKSDSESHAKDLLSALTFAKDVRLLKKLLRDCLDSTKIKPRDAADVILGVAENPHGFSKAWQFLRRNWNFFKITCGGGNKLTTMSRLLTTISTSDDQSDIDELEEFFKSEDLEAHSQEFQQNLEIAKSNVAWVAKPYLQDIKKWLNKNITNIIF